MRWVFERTISRKSDALGTGAIALSPLVDILLRPFCETRGGRPADSPRQAKVGKWEADDEKEGEKEDEHAPATSASESACLPSGYRNFGLDNELFTT